MDKNRARGIGEDARVGHLGLAEEMQNLFLARVRIFGNRDRSQDYNVEREQTRFEQLGFHIDCDSKSFAAKSESDIKRTGHGVDFFRRLPNPDKEIPGPIRSVLLVTAGTASRSLN